MLSKIGLHAAVLVTTIIHTLAQDEQQEQGLNRETVEHLLKVVSPSCRDEMQDALSEQTELTLECKEEIQSALRERNGDAVPPPGANSNSGAGSSLPPMESRDNTAIYLVVFFIALFLAALGGFCFWAYDQRSKVPKATDKSKGKGKKWLKKQAQKKAQKQQKMN